MWICSKLGFFSIANKGKPGSWQVRARVESDLRDLLLAAGLKTGILATPGSDYAFRVVVESDGLSRVFAVPAQGVDYPNFKSCLESVLRQRDKLPAYEDFWSAMRNLQQRAGSSLAGATSAAEPMRASAVVLRKGGHLARLLDTLNGFKEKYGHWPTRMHLPAPAVEALRATHLTPLGFQLLKSKLQLVEGKSDKLLAEDDAGLAFDYGKEGWSGKRSPGGADEWLWPVKI